MDVRWDTFLALLEAKGAHLVLFAFWKDATLRVECTRAMGSKGMSMYPGFSGER